MSRTAQLAVFLGLAIRLGTRCEITLITLRTP